MKKSVETSITEIFLMEAESSYTKWETLKAQPEKSEILYAKRRWENGKDYTFFPMPSPHIIAFLPKADEKRVESGDERLEKIRKEASDIFVFLRSEKISEAEIVDVAWQEEEKVLAFMEGLYLSGYHFDEYKKKKAEDIAFSLRSLAVKPAGLLALQVLCREVGRSRRLIDLPFTGLNARQLADAAKEDAQAYGLKVKVWSDAELAESGMGGLLGVNKGSIDKPTFTEMEYKPARAVNKKPLVFVGKGIVFDAGGMNIKTGSYMDEMKTDMAGAAVAMGIIRAAAALKLPVYLKALLPATDNRLNGNALVSGDIIKMYDGTSVEVVNTDAEGRLILSDAVAYAVKNLNPELIVTIATLTGAASRALGSEGIVAMQEGADDYAEALLRAGERTHERICWFPMWKEYEKELKSEAADLKNCGNGAAGMITAAKFLKHFAPDVPFVHLDVAGVEYLSKRKAYQGPGATACGIRLITEFLRTYSKKQA